jgi:MFS family permease
LSVRNFRLFFIGEGISLTGSFMQMVAQAWLVLELTDSAAALGLVAAFQFLPVLLLGPYGGVLGDRLDKRKMLIGIQLAAMGPAIVLGILSVTGHVELWIVLGFALVLGLCGSLDGPARNAFVLEMVGREKVTNAVSLNTTLINVGRLFGPAVAGLVISLWGVGPCFFANAASYLVATALVVMIRPSELHPAPPVARASGQLREGLRAVWADPALRIPLLMMLTLGTFAYEWAVILPVAAKEAFGMGAGGYGVMQTFISFGAIAGGLYVAGHVRPTHGWIVGACTAFGVGLVAFGLSPTFPVVLVVLVGVGAASVMFATLVNSALQLAAPPEMRARVMSLFSVAWIGTTPIGGPLIGWISQVTNVRVGILVGAVAALVTGAVAWPFLARTRDPARDMPASDAVVSVPDPAAVDDPLPTEPVSPDVAPA